MQVRKTKATGLLAGSGTINGQSLDIRARAGANDLTTLCRVSQGPRAQLASGEGRSVDGFRWVFG